MNDGGQSPSQRRRSALLAGLGIAVLVGLVWFYGTDEVLGALRDARLDLVLAAFVLFCLQIPILTLRWWWILRRLGMPTRFSDILAAHCGASVTNFMVPGHVGEAVLSAWLGRTGRAPGVEAFTALVACKVLSVLIALGLFVAGLLATDAEALQPMRAPALGALALGSLALLVVLRVGGGTREDAVGVLRLVHRARATLLDLGRSPSALAVGFFITLFNTLLVCVVLGLVFAACGAPLGAVDTVLLRSLDTVGHGLAGWMPGNLGVDEIILTFGSQYGLSIDGPVALSSALLHRAIVLGYVLVAGGIFAALGGRGRRGPPGGREPP